MILIAAVYMFTAARQSEVSLRLLERQQSDLLQRIVGGHRGELGTESPDLSWFLINNKNITRIKSKNKTNEKWKGM